MKEIIFLVLTACIFSFWTVQIFNLIFDIKKISSYFDVSFFKAFQLSRSKNLHYFIRREYFSGIDNRSNKINAHELFIIYAQYKRQIKYLTSYNDFDEAVEGIEKLKKKKDEILETYFDEYFGNTKKTKTKSYLIE